jgi:chondroitin AC lyase
MRRTLVLLILAASIASPLSADDLADVRRNFRDFYTAADGDRSSPRMQEALAALESVTRDVTRPGYLLADGSWTDVNYAEVPSGRWSPWEHFRRLTVMAKAYQTPGQSFYRDPQLLASINAVLRRAKDVYGPTTFPAGNWWFWTLGVPLDLGPSLVLLQEDADRGLVDDLTTAIAVKIGSGPTSRGISGPVPVGENLVWSSFAHLCVALLRNDAARLAKVRDAMATVTVPSVTAEGVKPDYSFHQHGAQLYNGGYGGSFANDVARYALITRSTSYALPSASNQAFANYLAEGISWTMIGSDFDVSVVGREVARPSTSGFNGLAGLVQYALVPSPRNGEIRSAAAKVLQTWNRTLPTELAGLTSALESAWPASPSGHRHFFASDYTVHRRPGWFASVKMLSIRTKSGESTNGENLLGSRQSDGRLSLSLESNDGFGHDAWPLMDWARLPGITVELRPDAASSNYGYGTRALAGGTSDGTNGVSAMEVAPLGSTLTARKSWFFFDDAIVFLTSGITSPGPWKVETVVNHAPLRDGASSIAESGSKREWIVAGGIGYWFPSPGQNVRVTREIRSGSWSTLATSSSGDAGPMQMLTIAIDHGTQPVNADAEYVIVPNVSAESMQAWTSSRPIEIVANTASVAAARDLRNGVLGVVFWSAGSRFEGMQADAPLVAQVSDDGRALHLSAADPTAGTSGAVRLTLPGRFTSGDVKVVATTASSTTIEIPRNGGRTTSATLTRLPPARTRAVGRR